MPSASSCWVISPWASRNSRMVLRIAHPLISEATPEHPDLAAEPDQFRHDHREEDELRQHPDADRKVQREDGYEDAAEEDIESGTRRPHVDEVLTLVPRRPGVAGR